MNHSEKFLTFTDLSMIVLNADDCNKSMKPPMRYCEEIDSGIGLCYVCKEDFGSKGKTFLCNFAFEDPENECRNIHNGSSLPGKNTWVVRVSVDPDTFQLQAVNLETESMMFMNEACHAICEYKPNKMVIHATLTHLFIVNDWKVLHRIDDGDSKNREKHFISPIPNFDEVKFPFIITSGESSFNILNVNNGEM